MKDFYQKVELEIVEKVAYVYLSNEKKHNALDLDLLQGLVDAAAEIKQDKNIRAVILQGRGQSFSAGLDVAAVTKGSKTRLLKSLIKVFRSRNLFQKCALVWRDLPVPVIAVLRGYCFGGGVQIAMGADFRIADVNTKLSIMESKWGLIPDMSGLVTFPDSMRLDQAKFLSMSADVISAEHALKAGLITEISQEPLVLALEWVEKFSNRSPDTMAVTKKLFHRTWNNSSERKKLFWETWLQVKLLVSKNQRVAVSREMNKAQGREPTKKREYFPRS